MSRPLPALGRRPELAAAIAAAAILNLWDLSVNGWANTYYAAAVRSMASRWHDFLFAAMDRSGLMTVDKPPLSLWIQALSVRVFGYHPLAVLVPQALMGVGAVVLVYDLVARRFGRAAGFAAGIVLAVTPVAVAMSRHNNPDELTALLCVAALWCAVRALETGRTRWLVWAGVMVGLGFEAKMGVALMVVPGIALAYLWVAPAGRVVALRQLLWGGLALTVVGLAWPVLVTLTPASDRPWISGTSDNSIWSLILGYNGLGRVAGQTGGPGGGFGGGPGGLFGGGAGPLRLLNSALGGQAGWLLGFALVGGVAVLVSCRLHRDEPRTGWLIAVGGAFAVSAVVFSFASGIFHPYYVSFLAPFAAALVGAGVGEALRGGGRARLVGPLAVAAGALTELVVLSRSGQDPSWGRPVAIAVGGAAVVVLALALVPRARAALLGVALVPRARPALLGVALAALLAAPAAWATDTLGHPTSSTFPAGGPTGAAEAGLHGGPGGRLGAPAGLRGRLRRRFGAAGAFLGSAPPPIPGAGGFPAGPPGGGLFGGGGVGGGPLGRGGSPNGSAGLAAAIDYARAHGGGTIAVQSQSQAASAIVASDADVAGLGGFSGRESSITASWLAMEVRHGRVRWVIPDSGGFGGPGDSRQGSRAAFAVAARVCRPVTLTGGATMYDCQGRAAQILTHAGGS